MEKFWRAAVGVAGIGAVAFFVFLGLYKRWLSLNIFSSLTSQQTFVLMILFLVLTFLALIAGVMAWRSSNKTPQHTEDAALHRLEAAWAGVNYINCKRLIGPDVARVGDALHLTSMYWRNEYITKATLVERYGKQFCELFDQLDGCDKKVPGYDSPEKRCGDFLPPLVRATYVEISRKIQR